MKTEDPSATSETRRKPMAGARLRRDVGPIGLMFVSLGSIIGSGWLFGALAATQIAGPAAIISWVIGMVMTMMIALTYAEVGTMFPQSGGIARYPHYSFGSFASFNLGWANWLGVAAAAPIEVLATVQYATSYLPWLERVEDGVAVLTAPGLVVSIGLMAVFVVINALGVRFFARINNVLVWWKIGVIVVVIIALFLVSFHPSHFTDYGGFAPTGMSGIFGAITGGGIAVAYGGFQQAISLAGESRRPQRDVPLTVIGSLLIAGVLYIALQIAFIGAIPTSALTPGGWSMAGEHLHSADDMAAQFGPLAAVASALGMGWLATLLYADAIVSPGDTGMIYVGTTARMSYAMGRNANAPAALAKVSRTGVPWVGLVLAFIVGCIFFLPFPGWQKLIGFQVSATLISFGSGPVVLLAMRKQLPRMPRPFRLRAPRTIAFLALWVCNLIIYWTGWEVTWKIMMVVLIGFALFAVARWRTKGTRVPIDLRYGWWILLWYVGITVIGYLGSYPAASDNAGNLGLLTTAWALLANAVLAVVVLVVAVCIAPDTVLHSDQPDTEDIPPASEQLAS
ncbi:APC family permease [Streptomyces sp. RS2]|uniref:APC family permease n=1 Tax=Streptomyces sp. RS2 TaxID=1451205 RepID=UPI0021F86430|nr:APC family permease [Streptomyces sp. RS2]MCW1100189.1 APC family permease [Streptomyces sp. RS2]